jgi:hypothetical protein
MSRNEAREAILECRKIKDALNKIKGEISSRDEGTRHLEKRIKDTEKDTKEQVTQVNTQLIILKMQNPDEAG